MDSFKQTKQGSFIGTPEQYLPKAPVGTYNQRVIVTNNYSVYLAQGLLLLAPMLVLMVKSSVIKDAVYEPVVDQVVEPVVEQVPEQLKEQFKSNSSNQAKEVKEAHISEVYEEPTQAQDPSAQIGPRVKNPNLRLRAKVPKSRKLLVKHPLVILYLIMLRAQKILKAQLRLKKMFLPSLQAKELL